MGTSTKALLIYGYNLGDGDAEWLVEETTGEHGSLQADWFNEGSEDDFDQQAQARLLLAAGFTETDRRADGYFTRKREAEEKLGVKFARYCSAAYPAYTLAAHVITVPQGKCELLNLDELARTPSQSGWDDNLTAALRALGLTPKQPAPAWLFTSFWG